MIINRSFILVLLASLLTGCTLLNTPVKTEWYNTKAQYTWISSNNSNIKAIKTGEDLRNYSYRGGSQLSLRYAHSVSGGDAVTYYSNAGNFRGFVYGAGPDKANLDVKIGILKEFVVWSEQSKEQRLASQGLQVEYFGHEYIRLEHPDGPVLMDRVSASSQLLCGLQKDCYAAFINPDSAKIMIAEFTFIGSKKFSKQD